MARVQTRRFTAAPNHTQPWTCRIVSLTGKVIEDFTPPRGVGGFSTEADARAFGEQALQNLSSRQWSDG